MATAQNCSEGDALGQLKIRPVGETSVDLVALGEVMLRFDPGEDRISRARSFRVWEGGGEYNVARGLRRCFGLRSSIVTALVDNPVGRLVEDLILQGGVDTSNLRWRPFDGAGREARNGLYFLERGFGLRGALAVMDRGNTAISQMQPGEVDWDGVLRGARWFHTGGVMAGLSENATEVVFEAMSAARRLGVVVSFDCNYRPSLWKTRGGRGGAVAVNRRLMPLVDVLFGHEGDISLGQTDASQGPVWYSAASFGSMAERISTEFPNVSMISTSVRRAITANCNDWGAFCWTREGIRESRMFGGLEILDRVGGGDAFASGVIYGALAGRDIGWSLECGVAHGALTMTTPGDASMATLREVESLIDGGSAAVQR